MKKLVLKKDVVARIDNGSMNQLKGGLDTLNVCQTMPGVQTTCTAFQTCEPMRGCDGGNTSGIETCGNTGGYTVGGGNTGALTCNGVYTCDICKGSQLATMCDTACGLQCKTGY